MARGAPNYDNNTWPVTHNGQQADLYRGCIKCTNKEIYAPSNTERVWGPDRLAALQALPAADVEQFLRDALHPTQLASIIGHLKMAKLWTEASATDVQSLVNTLSAAYNARLSKKGKLLEPTEVTEEYHKVVKGLEPYRRFLALRGLATASATAIACCWPETQQVWLTCAGQKFQADYLQLQDFFAGPASVDAARRQNILPRTVTALAVQKLEEDFWGAYTRKHAGRDTPLQQQVLRAFMTAQLPDEPVIDYLERANNHFTRLDGRRPPGTQPIPEWLLEQLIVMGLNPLLVPELTPPPSDTKPLKWREAAVREMLTDKEAFCRKYGVGLTPTANPNNKAHCDGANQDDINAYVNARHRMKSKPEAGGNGGNGGNDGNGGNGFNGRGGRGGYRGNRGGRGGHNG